MSMQPNNPFESRNGTHNNQPQAKPTNVWLWVFATIGVLFVGGSLVCCGGGYFLFNKATEVIADAAAQKLRASPVVKEHLGEIESAEINLGDTLDAQQVQEGAERMIVLDVKGSKADGRVEVTLGRNEKEFKGIELVLDDGTRHEIRLESLVDEEEDAASESASEPSEETTNSKEAISAGETESDVPSKDPFGDPFGAAEKQSEQETVSESAAE